MIQLGMTVQCSTKQKMILAFLKTIVGSFTAVVF